MRGISLQLPLKRKITMIPASVLRAIVTFLLLLICGAYAPGVVAASDSRSVPTAWSAILPAPDSSFAIADLDGDHRPDIASVQSGRGGSRGGYWVGLRLSDAGRHYVRLAGPSGGLRVEARDVNGDNAVDLVFATAWLGEPVAVLLNDGHGNFSQAKPSSFPHAFSHAKSHFTRDAANVSVDPGFAQESSRFFSPLRNSAAHAPSQVLRFRLADTRFTPSGEQGSSSDRAPPFVAVP